MSARVHTNATTTEGARHRKTVTIAEEILELGEELAAQENRSFSNFIETLILRDAGKLPRRQDETGEEVAA